MSSEKWMGLKPRHFGGVYLLAQPKGEGASPSAADFTQTYSF
ncbi:hypothetical protein QT971_19670 [Microcoleus sp. herbarium19]